MGKRIGVMGAGAVGSYMGAFMSRAGYDVTLIDPWGAHIDRIKGQGLHVSGFQGNFTVQVKALHLAEAQQVTEPFDVIFLPVKSYDTEWAAHFAKRFLAEKGIMVSSQNCMNDLLIASIVGYEREVPCVVSGFAVALWEPGHVQRRSESEGPGHKVFRVGELHGKVTPRVEELAEILSCIDGAYATSNIWGERWSKLTLNAVGNPVSAMTGLGSQGVAEYASARRIEVHLAMESMRVGLALSYNVDPYKGVEAQVWARANEGDTFEELESIFHAEPGREDWQASMAQDVIKGRKTEIDQMNRYIVDRGREAGTGTPVNAAVVQVVSEIEMGRLVPEPANLDRVLSMTGL
jgi:2-dehydropantoate 2-reductase